MKSVANKLSLEIGFIIGIITADIDTSFTDILIEKILRINDVEISKDWTRKVQLTHINYLWSIYHSEIESDIIDACEFFFEEDFLPFVPFICIARGITKFEYINSEYKE